MTLEKDGYQGDNKDYLGNIMVSMETKWFPW